MTTSRPWALPVLVALYRPRELNEREGRRRHKTPIVLARQLMAALMHGFPERTFILLGDGGFASHELARFGHRHRRRLTLVSSLHPRAHLCEPPPARRKGQMGRPRVRGARLPHPADVVADRTTKRKRATVGWYGGKARRVAFVSGVGHWYKASEGLVPIRWVFVHDLDGTHEDRYVYSTDPSMDPGRIITLYTARWSIEVTFQEAKQHRGLAGARARLDVPRVGGRSRRPAGRRVAAMEQDGHEAEATQQARRGAQHALLRAVVRRLLWRETVFMDSRHDSPLKKLPFKLRDTLLDRLSCAA